MREIKFRAWDKIANEMHDNSRDFFFLSLNGKIKEYNYSPVGGRHDFEQYLFDSKDNRLILMQYTGLKDKNGVEIYEGDILEIYCEENEELNQNGVVEYEKAKFYIRCSNHKQWVPCLDSPNLLLKIIGNIYENPELMEAENE